MTVVWCNRYDQRPERLPGRPNCEIRDFSPIFHCWLVPTNHAAGRSLDSGFWAIMGAGPNFPLRMRDRVRRSRRNSPGIGFTHRLRRLVDGGSGYGLALEGITAADVARNNCAGRLLAKLWARADVCTV